MWRSPLLKWKTQEEEQVVRDHIFKDVKFEMFMRPQAYEWSTKHDAAVILTNLCA